MDFPVFEPEPKYQEEPAKLRLYEIDKLSIKDLLEECKNGGVELETVLTALFVSLNQGSLCLKLTASSVSRHAGLEDMSAAGKIITDFIADAMTGIYDTILS